MKKTITLILAVILSITVYGQIQVSIFLRMMLTTT